MRRQRRKNDKIEHQSKADNQRKAGYEGKDGEDKEVKRMKQLKKQVVALKTQSIRQEAGVIRPYPAEWDSVPYL